MSKTTNKDVVDEDMHPDAMERMERALKGAMSTPPKPHKNKPKRGKGKDKKASD